MDRKMNGEEAGLGQNTYKMGGWNTAHKRYKCRDGMLVEVPCRTAAYVMGKDKTITRLSNTIRHARDAHEKLQPRIAVSGVEFDRGMRLLFGGSDGIRTIIFPSMLKIV